MGLELGLSLGHPGLGLGLGSSDVLDSLGEVLLVERLDSVQGGVHAGGSSLELGVSMGAVLGHLVLDAMELGSGLGSDNLHLVGGPLAEGLVLVGELGSKLGAASLSLGASVVELLVELANGLLEVLTGLLGVRLDLASILGDVGVGLLDAVVEGSGHSGAGLLLGEHSSLKVLVGERLILGDLLAHLLGTLLVGVST